MSTECNSAKLHVRLGSDSYPQYYIKETDSDDVLEKLHIYRIDKTSADNSSVTKQLFDVVKTKLPDYYYVSGSYGYDDDLARRLLYNIDEWDKEISLPHEPLMAQYYKTAKYKDYEILEAIYSGYHCDRYMIVAPKKFFAERFWKHTRIEAGEEFAKFKTDLINKLKSINPENIYVMDDGFIWQSGYNPGYRIRFNYYAKDRKYDDVVTKEERDLNRKRENEILSSIPEKFKHSSQWDWFMGCHSRNHELIFQPPSFDGLNEENK